MVSTLSICDFLVLAQSVFYCGGLQSDLMQNIGKTCNLKWSNQLAITLLRTACYGFFLVVHAFILLLGTSMWKFSSKAQPLIWTVSDCPGLLLRVTVLPVILGTHFLMGLTAHADVLIPTPFIRCESAASERRRACLRCNEWLAPWHRAMETPLESAPCAVTGCFDVSLEILQLVYSYL